MLSVVESMGNSGPDKRFLLVLVVSVVSAALSGSAFCGIIWSKRRKRKCKHNFVHFCARSQLIKFHCLAFVYINFRHLSWFYIIMKYQYLQV